MGQWAWAKDAYYTREAALKNYFQEKLTDPRIQFALAQIASGEAYIDKIMAEHEENAEEEA